jgi:hydroxymethylpyrimidine pyrophosphatase-like HAD family hydrolase
MIFASDLDGTLIYSKRFIPKGGMQGILPVELKGEKYISYMTEGAAKSLKNLVSQCLFVPVTTRTVEQYKRIFFIKDEIRPKYAIVSNGGNLIINGELDINWRDNIQRRIKSEAIELAKVQEKFMEINSPDWVIDHRVADDLFSYCIVDRNKIPLAELEDFREWLRTNNWNVSLQGRKIYFVPHCICKGMAIEYIKEIEGCSKLMAAGDSLLDLPMLEMADYALCPPHGELSKYIIQGGQVSEGIMLTQREGISAAEEIICRVDQFSKGHGKAEDIK